MKLSHLYTNHPAVFTPIRFREGLNVILARINHPADRDKISHNLGKTLLIDVIEFCLLKEVGQTGHFLKSRDDLFGDLVFFLEIHLHAGGYLTVRRPVRNATSIAFKRHSAPYQDLSSIPDEDWDHAGVSRASAERMLDSYLALAVIKPWTYRKGVSYFMRRQEDYRNEFQLAKFSAGKHKDWKPYVARVLGFDDGPILKKYEADAAHERIKNQRDELQAVVSVKSTDYEKLRASISVKRDEVDQKVGALDRFDFHAQESGLTRELADHVEQEIASTGEQLYNARFDLAKIERGLQDDIHFDLSEVQRIFAEAEITFPAQLARDYDELVKFNRSILSERRASLLTRANQLHAEISRLEDATSHLSERRRKVLEILGGTDSLQKFKDLQKQLDSDRAKLAFMEEQSDKVKAIRELNDDLRITKTQCIELSAEIEKLVNDGSPRYFEIQRTFSRIIKDVLQRTAVLYATQNENGNLDFHAEFTDVETDSPTQERRGTSFRQILCIAFDLAVLISYAHEPFFHFVYHDGGLERLERKRKELLLQVIRDACNQHGIQYLLSAIDEDLPESQAVGDVWPRPEEIVLRLHDGGQDGRLFKVAKF